MAKANKKERDKSIGTTNWWEYLEAIRPKGFRNIPCLLDYEEILSRTKQIEDAKKDIKNRKRQEKKLLNRWRFEYPDYKRSFKREHERLLGKKKRPFEKISGQIQRGYDIAHDWMFVDISLFRKMMPIPIDDD